MKEKELILLIDDYNRRIETINNTIETKECTLETFNRFIILQGAYKTFVSELKKLLF